MWARSNARSSDSLCVGGCSVGRRAAHQNTLLFAVASSSLVLVCIYAFKMSHSEHGIKARKVELKVIFIHFHFRKNRRKI